MTKKLRRLILLLLAVLLIPLPCCTTFPKHEPSDGPVAYIVAEDFTLLSRYAPVFVAEDPNNKYNLIGTPAARSDENGEEEIYVNPEKATVYAEKREFKTSKSTYINLIYRIHFEEIPGGFIPFYIGKGENVGLIVVITLNSQNDPILYTTVHTCGCYLAFVPTSFLAVDEFPDEWKKERQSVHSENLPGLLDYRESSADQVKTMILLRRGSHRVKDIWLSASDSLDRFNIIMGKIKPLASLEQLPLNAGETTSFYETSGPRKGYVKGSHKIRERVLMSWWTFDWRIGEDKKLGRDKNDGILFYTSVKPWDREESDMRDFATFLRYWKWKL